MAEKTTTKPTAKQSVFEVLSSIDCKEHLETKKQGNGLTYLSWAWAWHICKEHYPDATYTIYENAEGRPYFDDGRTAWVKTGVTIEGLEHIEYLPILDQAAHASLPLSRITSWDMNKSIQRSLTKALARHGLGLYVYAGEDLPWTGAEENAAARKQLGEQPAGTQRQINRTVQTAAPAPAPQEDPVQKAALIRAKWVKAIAEGIKTKSGMDPMDAFIKNFHPSEDDLANLEAEVMQYRLEHNIPANTVQQ